MMAAMRCRRSGGQPQGQGRRGPQDMSSSQGGGRLTTHILDTMTGRPAAGLLIELYRHEGSSPELLATVRTNADGRCDEPLLQGEALTPGNYELLFHVGSYLRAQGVPLPEPA